MPAPILVLTCGNPSRGDDALGSALHELLVAHKRATGDLCEVEVLTDFQLQIEHAVDLAGRDCVSFADASVSCDEPVQMPGLGAVGLPAGERAGTAGCLHSGNPRL